MVGVDGVDGLSNCEENEEDRCDQRDCRPGVPKVGVLKPRPPLVVGHAAVLHHVPEQLQVVVLLIVQVGAQVELVEELRHLLVLAELALDDLRLLEQRDVLLRRDEAVHEHRVAREARPARRVGLLEGHQVAEVGEAGLLYRQQRDLHDALLLVEDGVHEAHRPLLPPEPDPGLLELGGGGDASRRPLLLLGVVGPGGPPAAAGHRRYLAGEDAGQHEEERRRGEAPAPLQLLDHHASEGRLAAPVRCRVEGRVVQMEQVVHGPGLRLVREVLHLLPRQVGDREVRESNPGAVLTVLAEADEDRDVRRLEQQLEDPERDLVLEQQQVPPEERDVPAHVVELLLVLARVRLHEVLDEEGPVENHHLEKLTVVHMDLLGAVAAP
ncbi:UPF0481 protein [Iris pallida]|uniref:UPF0481 protein n=1 Tax=Iris pallida TaxID=29817 RepID=A0AAX6EVI2_IRIPA|nr:UPF0481 protein [Iris pallida]